MSSALNWDEFRLVRAIADTRSLVGAAERLGLNHSTVFRRLSTLEQQLGVRLFERSRAGYQPTPAGEEMVALASQMGDSVADFERRVAGRDIKPNGDLSVTTVDALALAVMPPILARFREAHPGVNLDLIIASQDLNLSRRDADVALRVTSGPSDTLVGRKICRIKWAVYANPEIERLYGADLVARAPWVAFGENYGPARVRRWLEKHVDRRRQICRVNAALAVVEFVALGVGAAALPCFLGDARDDLVRIGAPPSELESDLWLLTHADLRHSARVRAFMDFAGTELIKLRKLFEGEEE